MTRRSCPFTQRDVARAVRGVKATGLPVLRIEVDVTGKIIVVVAEPDDTVNSQNGGPLDQWMARHADQTQGH
jgi:hypothetical protein